MVGHRQLEVTLNDISCSQSEGDLTGSEDFHEIHALMEQNEYFVRARPEIRKVKASGRSTEKIHVNGETFMNFNCSLGKLEKLVSKNVFCDYLYEGIHYLPWPVSQPCDNLTVNFNRYY
jgi:hypothetical protein